jgi:outer membrane protein assembly factor BamB
LKLRSNVYNPIVGQTFSAQRISDRGDFISASTAARENHCLPAIDSEGTEYWLDQANGKLRATRSDGSTKWHVDVSALYASNSERLRTTLAGADAVAAEYGGRLQLHDRATGALRWIADDDAVYDQTGRFDGLAAAWSANPFKGLLRTSQTGTTQIIDSTQFREGTKLLPLRAGGVVAVQSKLVSRFAADGALQWRFDVSTPNESVDATGELLETTSGDIVVTGRDSGGRGFFARISATGVLRHRVSISSFSGSDPEPYLTTVSAVAERGNGELVIGIDNNDQGSSKGPMLRTYDLNGVERARFVEAFAAIATAPSFRFADILVDGNGAAVLGYGQDKLKNAPSAFLFKIDSLDVAASQLQLLSALPTNTRYDTPFNVTVGLRTQAGLVTTATRAITVRLSPERGLGSVSSGFCVIEMDQSQCTISEVRAHPAPGQLAPTTARLRITADGYPALVTTSFGVSAAPTTTMITILSPQPLQALSEFRFQIDVTSANPVEQIQYRAEPNGCVAVPTTTGVLRLRCVQIARAPAVSLEHRFVGSGGAYQSSSASTTFAVKRTPVTIRPVPNLPVGAKAGARFSIGAYVLLPDGRDVWPSAWPSIGAVSLRNSEATILCPSMPFPASPHSCEARETRVGTDPLTIVVDATDQILGGTLSIPFTVTAAYGIEGSVGLAAGASVPDFCFVPKGPTCTVAANGTNSARFECSSSANWSGKLYLKQEGWRFVGNGGTLGPLSVIEQRDFFESGATTVCTPDVNKDGSVELDTDGVFVLRKLFGMIGETDFAPLAHACASRTYAEASAFVEGVVARGDWDLDGDGAVLPLTDGLLLLRSMLGIYGAELTHGAVNPQGSRTDAIDIATFLQSRCGSVFRN